MLYSNLLISNSKKIILNKLKHSLFHLTVTIHLFWLINSAVLKFRCALLPNIVNFELAQLIPICLLKKQDIHGNSWFAHAGLPLHRTQSHCQDSNPLTEQLAMALPGVPIADNRKHCDRSHADCSPSFLVLQVMMCFPSSTVLT